MRNSIINSEKEVNTTLLDEFKMQEDVNMIGQLLVGDGFRCADFENADELADVSKGSMADFKNHSGELLNIIYLTCKFIKTMEIDERNCNVGQER